MPLPTTENLIEGDAIDTLPALDAVNVMLNGQIDALQAMRQAGPAIVQGSGAMAPTIRDGGSIIYAAAGSSGLMALADACELPGTFGISPDRIQIHMAGGVPADGRMPGDTEDDRADALNAAQNAGPGDVLIVLSASGTTPYAVQVARAASENGADVIGIASNPGTELLNLADVAICLNSPPEVVAGSTRMGAGTAQKAALNLMSTLMGAMLGHVHQGMMVNVVADNAKLMQRARRMVSSIAGVSDDAADQALAQAKGQVKLAALIAAGHSPDRARALLIEHSGHLGPCFDPTRQTQQQLSN